MTDKVKLPKYRRLSVAGILSHRSKSAKAERAYMRLRKRLMLHIDHFATEINLSHIDRQVAVNQSTGKVERFFSRPLTDTERLDRKVAYRMLQKSIQSDKDFYCDLQQILSIVAEIRQGKSRHYNRSTDRTDKSQELTATTNAIVAGKSTQVAVGILVDKLLTWSMDDTDYVDTFDNYRRDDWHGQS